MPERPRPRVLLPGRLGLVPGEGKVLGFLEDCPFRGRCRAPLGRGRSGGGVLFLGRGILTQGDGHFLILALDLAAHFLSDGGNAGGQQALLLNRDLAVRYAFGVVGLLQLEGNDEAGVGGAPGDNLGELLVYVLDGSTD